MPSSCPAIPARVREWFEPGLASRFPGLAQELEDTPRGGPLAGATEFRVGDIAKLDHKWVVAIFKVHVGRSGARSYGYRSSVAGRPGTGVAAAQRLRLVIRSESGKG